MGHDPAHTKSRNVDGSSGPVLYCPIAEQWLENLRKANVAMEQINQLHASMAQMMVHTSHLSKLDALTDIRDSLLAAAVGRGQIELKTANRIFTMLGTVILGLLFVIVVLLTGEKAGIIGALFR